MDILVISATPSHPSTAGNRARIRSMLEALRAMGHHVHFCYLGREGADQDGLAAMERAWDEFTFIPYDRSREHGTLLDGVYAIDDWVQPNFRGFLEYYSSAKSPAVVLVEYVFLSFALTYFPRSFRVIDCHDVFANRHYKLDAIGVPRSFFYTTAEEEAKGLNRADLVVAIQEDEAEKLRRMTTVEVHTIGYLPSESSSPTVDVQEAGERERIVGYIGSVNPINVAALRVFLEGLDLAKLAAQGWRLIIAGTVCGAVSGGLREQAVAAGVEFRGEVDDPVRFLEGCRVVVNPHMGGTGLKIKTIDAMAAGCCVVGTADAFEGIPTTSPWHRLLDAATIAATLPELLADENELTAVTEATRTAWDDYRGTALAALSIFADLHSLSLRTVGGSLLIVTDIRFWQEKLGNQTRLAYLLRSLPRSVRPTVFFLASLSAEDRADIDRWGTGIEVVSFSAHVGGFNSSRALHPETGQRLEPLEKNHFVRKFFYALERFLSNRRFDMIMFEYIRLSYLRLANGIPATKLIDTHDIMSMRSVNFKHFGKAHFIDISSSEEFRILDQFDYVGCIQRHEFALVETVLPGKAIFLPHVAPLPPERLRPLADEPAVGFIGGNSPMNFDGIKWFLAQVWPLFSGSGAELHIAGQICEALRDDADAAQPGVKLLGQVDDIAEFYKSLSMAINPVYYGGGIKIKSVEAMSHGVPLVASPEAAFGLEQGARGAFLLARSRREFAEAVLSLLADEARCAALGAAGRTFVAEVASPRHIRENFDRFVQTFGTIGIRQGTGRSE